MNKNELYYATGVGSYYDRSYRSWVAVWPQKLKEDEGLYQTTMMKVFWGKQDDLLDVIKRIQDKKTAI
jgi:hypothetical protein